MENQAVNEYILAQLEKIDGISVVQEKVTRLERQMDSVERELRQLTEFRAKVAAISTFVSFLVYMVLAAAHSVLAEGWRR
jgi:hypothetical protein